MTQKCLPYVTTWPVLGFEKEILKVQNRRTKPYSVINVLLDNDIVQELDAFAAVACSTEDKAGC